MRLKIPSLSYDSGSIEVKNAIDPLIKIGTNIILPGSSVILMAGIFSGNNLLITFGIAIFSVYLLVCLLMYMYFAFKDPDRLHSEKYLLESKRIDLEHKYKLEKNISPDQLELTDSNSNPVSLAIDYNVENDKGDLL